MVLDGISWFILDCECLEEDSMCLQCLSCFCIFQNFRDLTWIIMDSPSVHRPYFFFPSKAQDLLHEGRRPPGICKMVQYCLGEDSLHQHS